VVIENRRSMALSCLFQLSPTDAIVLELWKTQRLYPGVCLCLLQLWSYLRMHCSSRCSRREAETPRNGFNKNGSNGSHKWGLDEVWLKFRRGRMTSSEGSSCLTPWTSILDNILHSLVSPTFVRYIFIWQVAASSSAAPDQPGPVGGRHARADVGHHAFMLGFCSGSAEGGVGLN
jgi:hypothetical protein